MVKASPLLFFGFLITVAVVIAGVVWAVRYAQQKQDDGAPYSRVLVALPIWILITGALAAAGKLHFDTLPPTAPIIFFAGIGPTLYLGLSKIGSGMAQSLPLAFLVGFQSFRILVELLLHGAYAEGLAPIQITYAGLNFDIITGITAALLGGLLLVREVPRWLLYVWNAGGLLLLLTVVTVALLSAPTPLRVFHNEPANVWITQLPWVWLPTVLVLAALLFHVLVFRRLKASSSKHTVQ